MDISDSAIKAVKVKKSGKDLFLSSFAEVELTPGTVTKGKIEDKNTLASAITALERRGKFGTKYVSISLPEEKSFLKIIRMPRMDRKDLESAVVYESENHLPLPIKDVYLDFQVLPSSENKDTLDILIAALPCEVADLCVAAVEKAGLFPVSLETESLSIARSLMDERKMNDPVLIVDIGQKKTSFIIFSEKSIRFAGSIQTSSTSFTEEISRIKNIELDAAEKFKLKNGIYEEGRNDLIKGIDMIIDDLAEVIERYMEYYQSRIFQRSSGSEGENIKEIIICGGGANIKGLQDHLSSKIKREIKIGDPFLKIQRNPGNISSHQALGYAVAIGSALREFEEDSKI